MIEQLKSEERELLIAIHENRIKQKKYYTKELCDKYGIKIGDTIKFKNFEEVKTRIITKFKYFSSSHIYPNVLLFNKDGTLGKKIQTCFSNRLETIEVIKSA